jgi:hypothetical protein
LNAADAVCTKKGKAACCGWNYPISGTVIPVRMSNDRRNHSVDQRKASLAEHIEEERKIDGVFEPRLNLLLSDCTEVWGCGHVK